MKNKQTLALENVIKFSCVLKAQNVKSNKFFSSYKKKCFTLNNHINIVCMRNYVKSSSKTRMFYSTLCCNFLLNGQMAQTGNI